MPDLIGHLFVIADLIGNLVHLFVIADLFGNLICTKLMFFLYI